MAFERLVLMGMKGCGKTTLGERLAEANDAEFVDTDYLLEDLYFERAGKKLPFREIFAAHGADYFKQLEADAIRKFTDEIKNTDRKYVVSLGGRSALNGELHDCIRGIGKIIYIRVDVEELYQRVSANGLPAFLSGSDDPHAKFIEIFETRREVYETLADEIADTSGCEIDQAVERLKQAVSV